MAIPNSPSWSSLTDVKAYPQPAFAKPATPMGVAAVSLGPIALNDSQGVLNSRYWLVTQNETGNVEIAGAVGAEWDLPVPLFSEAADVEQITLTFDQLGRPLVFYRTGADTLKLYWYDPVIQETVNVIVATGVDPLTAFDFPQRTGESFTDALLFYVRANVIYMRIQRERYLTEYICPSDKEGIELSDSGLRIDNRFQVTYFYDLVGYVPDTSLPEVIIETPDTIIPPPDPELPPPIIISGDYYYNATHPSCFVSNKIIDMKNDDFKIGFNVVSISNQEQFLFGSTLVRQLRAFVYVTPYNKIYLNIWRGNTERTFILNGTSLLGEWLFEFFIGGFMKVTLNNQVLFDGLGPVPNNTKSRAVPIIFAGGKAGPSFANVYSFEGVMNNCFIDHNNELILWNINQNRSPTQLDTTNQHSLFIENHRSNLWEFIQN